MTILSGGAYQAGAIRLADDRASRPGMAGTLRTCQITSPASGVDSLSQWLRLVPCPLGLSRHVLRARIHHKDYLDLGTRSGKGAEVNGRATAFLATWGEERIHYWRILVDPKWITYASETGTIIAQVHEVGTNSPGGQPPDFYVELQAGYLNVVQANDGYPLSRVVYSMPISPGQEFDLSVRCRWRDGIHAVPWATGYLQVMVNGAVVWEDSQAANCWADADDATQPFPVAGVYQPNQDAAWWIGRHRIVYHVGRATGDAGETHASLAAFVASQL